MQIIKNLQTAIKHPQTYATTWIWEYWADLAKM